MRIANPKELANELRTLIIQAREPNPSRVKMASSLRSLAKRVASWSPGDIDKDAPDLARLLDNMERLQGAEEPHIDTAQFVDENNLFYRVFIELDVESPSEYRKEGNTYWRLLKPVNIDILTRRAQRLIKRLDPDTLYITTPGDTQFPGDQRTYYNMTAIEFEFEIPYSEAAKVSQDIPYRPHAEYGIVGREKGVGHWEPYDTAFKGLHSTLPSHLRRYIHKFPDQKYVKDLVRYLNRTHSDLEFKIKEYKVKYPT
jgi:hypothetical protein